jgi:hypothetical protein
MKKISPAIACALLLTQCVMVYVPNTRNIPLLTKKAEIQGSAHISPFGVDLQAAGAVTNHFALMSNYAYYNRKPQTPISLFKMDYSFFEGGVGYFRKDDWKEQQFTSEIFAGFGKGNGYYDKTNSYDGAPANSAVLVSGSYNRFFIQPSIGYHSPDLDLGVAWRISLVDFTTLSLNANVTHPQGIVYMEPSVTVRINMYKRVCYMVTTGGLNFSPGPELGEVSPDPIAPALVSLSLGLGFRIGGIKFPEK